MDRPAANLVAATSGGRLCQSRVRRLTGAAIRAPAASGASARVTHNPGWTTPTAITASPRSRCAAGPPSGGTVHGGPAAVEEMLTEELLHTLYRIPLTVAQVPVTGATVRSCVYDPAKPVKLYIMSCGAAYKNFQRGRNLHIKQHRKRVSALLLTLCMVLSW